MFLNVFDETDVTDVTSDVTGYLMPSVRLFGKQGRSQTKNNLKEFVKGRKKSSPGVGC